MKTRSAPPGRQTRKVPKTSPVFLRGGPLRPEATAAAPAGPRVAASQPRSAPGGERGRGDGHTRQEAAYRKRCRRRVPAPPAAAASGSDRGPAGPRLPGHGESQRRRLPRLCEKQRRGAVFEREPRCCPSSFRPPAAGAAFRAQPQARSQLLQTEERVSFSKQRKASVCNAGSVEPRNTHVKTAPKPRRAFPKAVG